MSIFKIIFSVIFPPLGVFLTRGISKHLLINIILTILGFLPGVIHAIYLIGKQDSSNSVNSAEGQNSNSA